MFKKNFDPYKVPGRWVKFFLESDNTKYTLTTSDLAGCSVSTTYLSIPSGMHILTYMMDINTEGGTATSAANATFTLRRNANGTQALTLPPVTHCDYVTVYAYII